MMVESRYTRILTRKDVHSYETTGNHAFHGKHKTHRVNNIQAIARQQPASHLIQQWRNSWKRRFLCDLRKGYIMRAA
jgi:hypothetical protein